MAASVKEQIVTALKLEIGRLDMAKAGLATGSTPFVSGLSDVPKTASIAPVAPARPAPPPRRRVRCSRTMEI